MRSSDDDLGAMHMAALADLIGDAADLERMGARVPIGDEAADARRCAPARLRRAIPCSARLAVMRDTPKDFTISFSEGTRLEAPHLPEPMLLQNVPLHLQVERLQRGGRLVHGAQSKLYRQVQST